MQCLALAGTCPGFGASGLGSLDAPFDSRANIAVSAMLPKDVPKPYRKDRRDASSDRQISSCSFSAKAIVQST
jgi:hypothetical protein